MTNIFRVISSMHDLTTIYQCYVRRILTLMSFPQRNTLICHVHSSFRYIFLNSVSYLPSPPDIRTRDYFAHQSGLKFYIMFPLRQTIYKMLLMKSHKIWMRDVDVDSAEDRSHEIEIWWGRRQVKQLS